MIIEIALGIVLAVIILACLPLLIVASAWVIAVGICLLVGGGLLYVAFNYPEVLGTWIVILAFLVACGATINFAAKKSIFNIEEIGVGFVVLLFIGFCIYAVVENYLRHGELDSRNLYALPSVIVLVGVAAYVWRRAKSRQRMAETSQQLPTSD